MKSIVLKFPSIERLVAFVRTLEGGYCINMAAVNVKGKFGSPVVQQAVEQFGAEAYQVAAEESTSKDWL